MRRAAAVLQLTRPRQWPLLTAQLVVGVAVAPAMAALLLSLVGADAATGANTIAPAPHHIAASWPKLMSLSPALASGGEAAPSCVALAIPLLGAWVAWVVLLNGGTLAFNSAYDRDTGPVAYLPAPPEPPRGLAGIALTVMVCAPVVGGWTVGPLFAALTAGCVLLSVAYSHPRLRWKSVPGLDLLVNVVGYGAGTTLAGCLAGSAAVLAMFETNHGAPMAGAMGLSAVVGAARFGVGGAPWLIAGGFGLLFASLYPLTQIYQITEDRHRGDRTLAATLGRDAALILAMVLGIAATATLLAGARAWRHSLYGTADPATLAPLALALAVWLGHLGAWWARRRRSSVAQQRRGMYRALALWAAVDAGLLVTLYWPS